MVESPMVLHKIFNDHIDDYEIEFNCPFGDGHSARNIYQILKNLK